VIPADQAHLFVAASTHPGMKGKNNEDRFAVSAHQLGQGEKTPSLLAVICDGIGGHRAGEVAAEMAVETISRMVADSDGQQPLEILTQAFSNASQFIREQASNDLTQRGMGATCVCAWVIGFRLYAASLGDSRLYFLRGDTIRQITTDHTWIQEAIDFGALTPAQAIGHPNAHVIRRYLGAQTPMAPDFRLRLQPQETDEQAEANQGMRLLPGDRLLLCSDGLTDLVSKEEILNILRTHERKAAVDNLIDLANSRGGHDNITIVILEMPPDENLTVPLKAKVRLQKDRRRQRSWACLGSMLLLALLILLGILLWKFMGRLTTPRLTPTPSPVVTRQLFPFVTDTARLTPSAPGQTTPAPTASRTVTLPTKTVAPTNTSSPP
jgi:serine/threonine protein phosphatase PrpC